MINQIIATFFPSSIGTMIYIKNTENDTLEITILTYIINTLLTNLINFSLAYYLYDLKKFNFTNIFTIKYSLASIIISILIGITMTIINKYLKLKIEVVKNDKENNKNTKTNTKNNK